MDLTPIVLGIVAINLGVFLAGCALATYRTWLERRPLRPRGPLGTSSVTRVSERLAR